MYIMCVYNHSRKYVCVYQIVFRYIFINLFLYLYGHRYKFAILYTSLCIRALIRICTCIISETFGITMYLDVLELFIQALLYVSKGINIYSYNLYVYMITPLRV